MKRSKDQSKNKQSTTGDASVAEASFLTNILKGALLEAVFGILLILILCAIVYRSSDPDKLIIPASLVSLYLTAAFGGFVLTSINRKASLICGAISGVLLLAVTFVLSFAAAPFPYETYSNAVGVVLRFAIIPMSVCGAYIASKTVVGGSKKRKRTRKARKPRTR